MTKIIISPYKVETYYNDPGSAICSDKFIKVGLDKDDKQYSCDLLFNINYYDSKKQIIDKATVKLYCIEQSNHTQPTLIYLSSNQCTCGQTIVTDKGWYEWDITNLINPENGPLCVSLFTSTNEYNAVKEFCCHGKFPIFLELCLTDCQCCDEITHEVKQDCVSTLEWRFSKWIDCSCYNHYTFSIYNYSDTPVEAYIEISPNKKFVADSSPIYTVEPYHLVTIDPYKFNFFNRVAFKNKDYNGNNLITVWSQAQKK